MSVKATPFPNSSSAGTIQFYPHEYTRLKWALRTFDDRRPLPLQPHNHATLTRGGFQPQNNACMPVGIKRGNTAIRSQRC